MSSQGLNIVKIFEKLALKFNQPVLTETRTDSAGSYMAYKFFIMENPDALSEENLKRIEETNKILPKKIDTISFDICCFVLERNYIKIKKFKELFFTYNGSEVKNPFKNFPDIYIDEIYYYLRKPIYSIDVGDNGEAWIHNVSQGYKKRAGSKGDKTKIESWPATIADITKAMSMNDNVSEVINALVEIWAEKSFGWKKVYQDLKECPVLLPIPAKTVFDSQSKYELIYKYYGHAEKSAWEDHIGDSAFYERCTMLVDKKNQHLLKDFKPTKIFKEDKTQIFRVSNKKSDLILPLTHFIFNRMHIQDYSMYNGAIIHIELIEDAVTYTSLMREKVPLDLDTPEKAWKWCMVQKIRFFGKTYPLVKIPRNYCFKNLKITYGTMLTTRKALIDEEISLYLDFLDMWFGSYTYIDDINKGKCSIWRIEKNGNHYTAIITTDKNKRKFILKEILAEKGKMCEKSVYETISNEIAQQVPFKNPRKREKSH